MAGATATLTTLANILKELYLPPVVDQLNNQVLILQRLEPRSQELVGNEAVVPLHTSRSGGIGSRAENAALPASGNQAFAKAVFDLKYHYGSISVTGVAMAKTANTAGAFLKALQAELDGIRRDLTLDVGRQAYGDGSGKIATCGTTTTSNTVVLASAEAIRKGSLYIGMVVDIGTAAAPTSIAAAQTITAVNVATPSITITGATVSTTGANFVFRSGNAVDATHVNELLGISGIVSQAANTVGGIDASQAANSYWDNLRTNQAGPLTLDALLQAYNQVQIAGGETSAMICTPGMQRAYFKLLQAQVRYVEPLTIKGGFQVLEFMGKPFIADRLAPFGSIFLLDEEFVKVFSTGDWHFLDEDGNTLKWVVGFDAWQAVLARYMNLGVSRRNVQFLLYGLTDDPNGY